MAVSELRRIAPELRGGVPPRVEHDGVLQHEADVAREAVGREVRAALELAPHRAEVHRRAHHRLVLGHSRHGLEQLLGVRVHPQVAQQQRAARERVELRRARPRRLLLLDLERGELPLELARLLARVLEEAVARREVVQQRVPPHEAHVVRKVLEAGVPPRREVLVHEAEVHRALDVLRVVGEVARVPLDRRREERAVLALHELLEDRRALHGERAVELVEVRR